MRNPFRKITEPPVEELDGFELASLQTLIEDQSEKENVEVKRRAWCIQQATYADANDPIALAKKIYDYVFGETP